MAGMYQPANAALAATALRALAARGWRISEEAMRAGLEAAYMPGRFELLRKEPDLLIDGGHNPPAVEATVRSLRETYPGKRFRFILGVMADKDVPGIVDRLLPSAERFYCAAPPAPRAMSAEALAELIRERGGEARPFPSAAEAARRALWETPPDGAICALGSLYILEDVRRAVCSEVP